MLRTCADLVEEDEALVAPPVNTFPGDEGDIDDGEFWVDAEESDIEYDLDEHCDQGTVVDDGSCNELDGIQRDEQEEGQFHRSRSIITFLSVAIAMWSYRYNITHGALNALLKLLGLFLYPCVFHLFNFSTFSL